MHSVWLCTKSCECACVSSPCCCRRERLNTLSQQNKARQRDKSGSAGGEDRSPQHQEAGQTTKDSTLGQKAPEEALASSPAGGTEGDSGTDPLNQPSRDVGGEAPQTILDPLRYPPEDPPVVITLQPPSGESGGDPPQVLEPLHQPADYAAATPSHYQMSNNTFDNYVIAMHRKVVSTINCVCVCGGGGGGTRVPMWDSATN